MNFGKVCSYVVSIFTFIIWYLRVVDIVVDEQLLIISRKIKSFIYISRNNIKSILFL